MKTVGRKKKKSSVIQNPITTPTLQKAFTDFILYCPTRRFSRNLRRMLLNYLLQAGTKEPEVKELLVDAESLFRLLEAIEEERPRWLAESR